jgi:hypothetical protein
MGSAVPVVDLSALAAESGNGVRPLLFAGAKAFISAALETGISRSFAGKRVKESTGVPGSLSLVAKLRAPNTNCIY